MLRALSSLLLRDIGSGSSWKVTARHFSEAVAGPGHRVIGGVSGFIDFCVRVFFFSSLPICSVESAFMMDGSSLSEF